MIYMIYKWGIVYESIAIFDSPEAKGKSTGNSSV